MLYEHCFWYEVGASSMIRNFNDSDQRFVQLGAISISRNLKNKNSESPPNTISKIGAKRVEDGKKPKSNE